MAAATNGFEVGARDACPGGGGVIVGSSLVNAFGFHGVCGFGGGGASAIGADDAAATQCAAARPVR